MFRRLSTVGLANEINGWNVFALWRTELVIKYLLCGNAEMTLSRLRMFNVYEPFTAFSFSVPKLKISVATNGHQRKPFGVADIQLLSFCVDDKVAPAAAVLA